MVPAVPRAHLKEWNLLETRKIKEIKVGARIRKDLGNIEPLAQSIADYGLLNPITITPNGALLSGQRRLEACKQLGLEEVQVCIVEPANKFKEIN